MPSADLPRRAAVILAAGRGERMKSPSAQGPAQDRRSDAMLDMAIDTAEALGCDPIVVVVGNHSPEVRAHACAARLGEAARRRAGPAAWHRPCGARREDRRWPGFEGDVIVTYADVPLLTAAAVSIRLLDLRSAGGADVAVLGFEAAAPAAYGRLVVEDGALEGHCRGQGGQRPTSSRSPQCNSGVIVTATPAVSSELLRARKQRLTRRASTT